MTDQLPLLKRIPLICGFGIFLSYRLVGITYAQITDLSEDVLDADSQSGYEELVEVLSGGRIDLNLVRSQELSIAPFLSEQEARLILRFRRTNGPFGSTDDLYKIEGLGRDTAEALSRYGYVSGIAADVPPQSVKKHGKLISRVRLITKVSDDESGSFFKSSRFYQRTELSSGQDIDVLILSEKDPIEDSPTDFAAGYIEIKDKFDLDKIVLGNLRPGFAQGLIFSRWQSVLTTSESVKRKDSTSVGYRSSFENGALRGVFAKKSLPNFQGALFFSSSRMDAALDKEGNVTRIDEDGVHVSDLQKERKDALKEKLTGARLSFKANKAFNLGTTFSFSSFDPPFQRDNMEKRRFAFKGDKLLLLGWDFDWRGEKLNLFGEFALSDEPSAAYILGAVADLGEIDIRVLARNYAADFHSFHGSAFSSLGGEVNNEKGIFSGISWDLNKRTKIRAFLDQYSRPWRTFSVPLPTRGTNSGATIKYNLSRTLRLSLRFRSKSSENFQGEIGIRDKRKNNLRADAEWRLQKNYLLKWRIELSRATLNDGEKTPKGISVFGEIRFKPSKLLRINTRLTLFDTDSRDSAIYEFEQDLPGLGFPRQLNGRGIKWYLIGKYKLKWMILSGKYRIFKRETPIREFSFQTDIVL